MPMPASRFMNYFRDLKRGLAAQPVKGQAQAWPAPYLLLENLLAGCLADCEIVTMRLEFAKCDRP